MVQHFISEFHSVTFVFTHPQLISDQTKHLHCTFKRHGNLPSKLQLPSCNISFPNFIVSSSFAHTPSSSQSKRTHALRIQNTWELIITVATLLLPSCNNSFQNSSYPLHCTHPPLILDQKPHALDIQTHGNYGYHITTPVVEHSISELHCVLFICTHPPAHLKLKNQMHCTFRTHGNPPSRLPH
jgi:hypothetical protein